MHTNIYIAIFLFLTIGCKPKQSATESTSTTTTETESTPKEDQELTVDEPRKITSLLPIKIDESNNMKDIGDSYQIQKAIIEDDQLWLTLTYGGGCEEHQFQMLFDNAYSEGETDKSIQLTLYHNGNDDRCRSIVTQNLRFDLKSLQTQDAKELTIRLSGWEEQLMYKY